MLRLTLLVLCASAVLSVNLPADSQQLGAQWQRLSTVPAPAPKYEEALKIFNQTESDIMHLMFPKDIQPAKVSPVRIVFVVLDEIANALAHASMDKYNVIYEALADRLYRTAEEEPQQVVNRLLCVDRSVEDSVKKLKHIRHSNNVEKLCDSNPSFCNDILQAIIDADENKELHQEAKVLLTLGNASSIYKRYEKLFIELQHGQDNWAALEFLVSNKNILKPLLESFTEVSKLMSTDMCAKQRLPVETYFNVK